MIIPAGGSSSRQKTNKLLVKLGYQTVIEQTIENYIDHAVDIIVITGYERAIVKQNIVQRFSSRVKIIYNPVYMDGLASSLKTGIGFASDDYDYWGFSLGDKPFISQFTVTSLLEKLETMKPKILVPVYNKTIGHPNFFSTCLTAELAGISGDIGGRSIIKKHLNDTLFIPVEDQGVIKDMDAYFEQCMPI